MKPSFLLRTALCLSLLGLFSLAWAQEIPEEARKHMVRGVTALNMAKSPDELVFAMQEFESATRLAPEWPVAWFNLGSVQEKAGKRAEAIASFNRYLELAPGAEDAASVRDRVIALEYMQERAAQAASLSGNWGSHQITVTGNQFVATGNSEHSGFIDVFFSGDVPQFAKYGPVPDRFEGTIDGLTVKGVVTRAAFMEERSSCVIPEERAEFTGKVNPEGTEIVLKYERGHYRADWDGIFWGLNGCTTVTRNGTTPITHTLTRKPAQP